MDVKKVDTSWILWAFCGFFAVCWVSGCQTDSVEPGNKSKVIGENLGENGPGKRCGESYFSALVNEAGDEFGSVEVVNDDRYLWVLAKLPDNARIAGGSLYIGQIESLPLDAEGNPNLNAFKKSLDGSEGDIWTTKIPLSASPECYVISLRWEIDREGSPEIAWARGKSAGNGYFIESCVHECVTPDASCDNGTGKGQFTTYSQTEWATLGKSYLEKKFAKAFPTGMKIGCSTGLVINDAEAMLNIIPSIGDAKVLDNSTLNEGVPPGNRLLGEVAALTLNLGFDKSDDKFSASQGSLHTLIVDAGAFNGWSVSDILSEANSVLGGCASNYSPNQIFEVVHKINLNFLAGKESRDFLICPKAK